MIYFIQDTQNKAIKIGYSKNPWKRLTNLQSATPNKLVMLGIIHGGLEHERSFHEKFAKYRLEREWFQGCIFGTVMEIIARNKSDRPPPSNVIVVGDSDFRDGRLVTQTLNDLHARNPIAWVITGGDWPLDEWAWEWARLNRVEVYHYFPNWRKHGRYAGFKVGPQMLRSMFDPKLLLVFHTERMSTSTSKLTSQTQKMGIEV